MAFTLLSVAQDSIAPIARYLPETERFEAALPDKADGELLQTLIPLTQDYPVYLNGQTYGIFQPTHLNPPSCSDIPQIMGQWHLPARSQTERFQALSYAPLSPVLSQGAEQPSVSAENLQAMGQMLKAAFFAHQAPHSHAVEFMLDAVRSFPFQKTAGAEMALGLLISGRHKNDQYAAFCGQENFWVLGIWEQGRAIPLVFELHPKSADPQECRSADLVSSFSTGQALNHVLIQHSGYEWWDYSIYAWNKDNWQEIFRSRGGGC